MKFKVSKAILHTKGLESQYESEVTPNEIAVYRQIFDMMDGQEGLVLQCDQGYYFAGLTDEIKSKELCYIMEQDPVMGCYINQREEFNRAYDAGEYYQDAAFCLPMKAVEIIDDVDNGYAEGVTETITPGT